MQFREHGRDRYSFSSHFSITDVSRVSLPMICFLHWHRRLSWLVTHSETFSQFQELLRGWKRQTILRGSWDTLILCLSLHPTLFCPFSAFLSMSWTLHQMQAFLFNPSHERQTSGWLWELKRKKKPSERVYCLIKNFSTSKRTWETWEGPIISFVTCLVTWKCLWLTHTLVLERSSHGTHFVGRGISSKWIDWRNVVGHIGLQENDRKGKGFEKNRETIIRRLIIKRDWGFKHIFLKGSLL